MKPSDRNAEDLAADVLAVKTVIGQVLGRVHQLDPILADAIEGGFEDAVVRIQKITTRLRSRISAERAARAVAVVEALRAAMRTRSHRRVVPRFANDNR
jgi:hypothetical protein